MLMNTNGDECHSEGEAEMREANSSPFLVPSDPFPSAVFRGHNYSSALTSFKLSIISERKTQHVRQ